jgi:trans-aconitate methyltransferase
MPWGSWINAEIYDRFVRERPIYQWLNRVLVDSTGNVARAERILDLACGTGATTEACLRDMEPRSVIVGVDASEEMVRLARTNIIDPRAHFEVIAADGLRRLTGRFDSVVCNAAFWQFPSHDSVFAALAARTVPGTPVVFNAPAERVEGERAPIHPFQIALMREIENELAERFPSPPVKLAPAIVEATAARHGFRPEQRTRHEYEGVQGELIELMTIPAMIGPMMPGLSTDQRQRVVDRARQRCRPDLPVKVPWVYFRFRREAAAAG